MSPNATADAMDEILYDRGWRLHEGKLCPPADYKPVEPKRRRDMSKDFDLGAILEECREILEQRGRQYGEAQSIYADTAKLISGYLSVDVKPKDVCIIMALLKIGRLAQGMTDKAVRHDTYADAINYLVLAENLEKNDAT